MTEALKTELWGLIRDAQRYRELRKHRNRGYPEEGVPFVMDWEQNEDETYTGSHYYIREGEMDDACDRVLETQDIYPGDTYDRLLEGFK